MIYSTRSFFPAFNRQSDIENNLHAGSSAVPCPTPAPDDAQDVVVQNPLNARRFTKAGVSCCAISTLVVSGVAAFYIYFAFLDKSGHTF